jgi:response regulator NasT
VTADEGAARVACRSELERLALQVEWEVADLEDGVQLAREQRPNAVIVDFRSPSEESAAALQALRAELVAPVVLYDVPAGPEAAELALRTGAVAHLTRSSGAIEQPGLGVALGLGCWREFCEREQALESRKLVEQAKGILMETEGLRERDAFRRIQKLSMNSRKSMREVAEAILLADQARGI